jgi:hypothetical protein
VKTAEAVYQVEDGRWNGRASLTSRAKHCVDPNTVRQLAPGQAVLVSGGRAEKLQVIQAPRANNDLAPPRRPRQPPGGGAMTNAQRDKRIQALKQLLVITRGELQAPRPGSTRWKVRPREARHRAQAGTLAALVVPAPWGRSRGWGGHHLVAPHRCSGRGPDHEETDLMAMNDQLIPSPASAESASTPPPTGSPSTWTAASGGPPAPAAGTSWPRDDTRTGSSARRPAGPARSAWRSPSARNGPGHPCGLPDVDDMTLAEQIGRLRQLIARLRQLAVTDPETSVLPPAIINALDELADAIQLAVTNPEPSVLSLVIINALDELTEAIQQLRGDNAGRELGSV